MRLSAIMVPDPVSVPAGASLDALREVFEEHGFIGVPVTDEEGCLVGVVRRADVRRAELLRVLAKEAGLGLINGLVLGSLLGGAAFLWRGGPGRGSEGHARFVRVGGSDWRPGDRRPGHRPGRAKLVASRSEVLVRQWFRSRAAPS